MIRLRQRRPRLVNEVRYRPLDGTDPLPEPMDTLVSVTCRGDGITVLSFEPTRAFYARHLMAYPTWLLKLALRCAWIDFKGIVRGAPKPDPMTVIDKLGEP